MKIQFSRTIPFIMIMSVAFFTLIGLGLDSVAETPDDKTTMKEVKKETRDLMQALKGYTANEREEAIERTKDTLAGLDQRIEKLETRIDKKWNQMSKAARKETRENLKALRAQRLRVAEWYGRLKSSSVDAWEHVKKGFSESYDTMHDAWRKAMEAFDSSK